VDKEIVIVATEKLLNEGCLYPVLNGREECCNDDPCTVEWVYLCSLSGGCWDRATCPGCEVPIYKCDPEHSSNADKK